ncbi:hyalin-like [Patiria miniata]|uniref:HYR domain-containing protein n=1 Tax=Patiria miniata TaxID=46514 RepID=A0A914AS02_PATMI|nr:hyalin-like [Patiria miniata]
MMVMASLALLAIATACLILQMQTTLTNAADVYSFEKAVYTVAEDAGPATVYVKRTGPHDAASSTVDVSSSDGTAVIGRDYVAVSTTLNFQMTNNRVTVDVQVIDNVMASNGSGIHCFTLTLTNPNPSGTLGTNAQICITDNDNIFTGTCPPQEAVIESNGEAVIEANVTSDKATAVISWAEFSTFQPALETSYRCFPAGQPPSSECRNGGAFPITYTLNASDQYNRRIKVQYTVATQLTPTRVEHNCEFYVRVLDSIPPIITCPADLNVTAKGLNGTAVWTEPAGTDNSGVVTTNTYSPPLVLSIGSHLFTYTAEDSSGNAASCIFNITVTPDDVPPMITCPATATGVTDPGLSTGKIKFPIATVSDNSGLPIVPVANATSMVTRFPVGETVVEFVATDASGNSATCTFIVKVDVRKNAGGSSDRAVIIAIVCVIVAVLIVVVCAVILYMKRRRRHAKYSQASDGNREMAEID